MCVCVCGYFDRCQCKSDGLVLVNRAPIKKGTVTQPLCFSLRYIDRCEQNEIDND